jgi:non-ribosomal peptide synthetase component F
LGAAFSVADHKHPATRTLSVISIKPSIIIDDGNGRDLLKEATKPLDILDVSNLSFDNMPADNLDDVMQNDDLAYIVFTSGSTGKESLRSFRFRGTNNLNIMSGKLKGVEIEHCNLFHFIADSYLSGYVSIAPRSQVLQFATFLFDAAVLEWSQCLTLGDTYLADVIKQNKILFVHVTPSVLATLPTSQALPLLRQIFVGKEMVLENLVKTWRMRVQVQNTYGPTKW